MNKVLTLVFLFFCCISHAQWMDKYHKPTSDSSTAEYYSVCEAVKDSGFIEKTYFTNKSLQSIAYLSSIKPKLKNGKYLEYYKNGNLKIRAEYLNDLEIGKYYTYYENGTMESEREYTVGKLNGILKTYYESGIQRRSDRYLNGILQDGKCFGTKGQDTTYFIFEKMAMFKNGDLNNYRNYVMSKLVYPEEAIKRNISGEVLVGFSVNSKGKVVDVKVIRSPNFYLSKAAVDVILDSPGWEPAIYEGKKVKQQFIIPVIFQFQ